jgi:predicted RNA-binding Zn-ribbon protein involved in translation (DUF1610 family)
MSLESKFIRLIDKAPKVTCASCQISMTLRTLLPVLGTSDDLFRATYRCPRCGIDTDREFVCSHLEIDNEATDY